MNDTVQIVVIDDNPASLELLSSALSTSEVSVHTAGTPMAGLELVRKIRPQLVITDLIMPSMTGLDVLEEIVDFDPLIDVIVMTAHYTKSLAKQTVMRVRDDFSEFLQRDQVQVYDIMSVPSLTPYELNQKLIFIVKKEDDNLDRLLKAFETDFPVLQQKKVLIVDDEADLASVSFRKGKDGTAMPGVISQQIDRLRELSKDSDFLQVTATPYSLYLQPEEDVIEAGQLLFKPRRPAFTVVLPTHGRYVGGDYYFEKNTDAESPAYYFYREVPLEEREALKVEDRRRIKIEHILSGGAILRLQARARKDTPDKYAFLFHTEQARKSHD